MEPNGTIYIHQINELWLNILELSCSHKVQSKLKINLHIAYSIKLIVLKWIEPDNSITILSSYIKF